MLEIRGACRKCGIHFRRPAADRIPAGYCTGCWTLQDRHLTERDALADRQAEEQEEAFTVSPPRGGECRGGMHYPPGAEELTLGRKHDIEKPRIDLLVEGMPRALEEVARVLTFGSLKYADHNWLHVDRAPQRYLAAGMRHELALATGETHDPETGAHHLAHKLCCDLFRLELALRGEEVTCR